MEVTQVNVKNLFDYREDGALVWKNSRFEKYNGRVAGFNATRGYRQVNISGKKYLLHRLIWLWHKGVFPKGVIDHINQNNRDNRIENLRDVHRSINSQNSKVSKNSPFGITGIVWVKKRGVEGYEAKISKNKKPVSIKYTKDFVEAVAHRLAVEQCMNYGKRKVPSSAELFMKNYLSTR